MPHSRTLATPTNPDAKGATFYGASTIAAPAALLWSIILDFSSYPDWNTFTPHLRPDSEHVHAGTKADMRYTLNAPAKGTHKAHTSLKSQAIEVTVRDDERMRLAWKAVGLPKGMDMEKVMEIQDFGDGQCEFRSFDTAWGWRTRFMVWSSGVKWDQAEFRVTKDLQREVARRLGRVEMVDEAADEDEE